MNNYEELKILDKVEDLEAKHKILLTKTLFLESINTWNKFISIKIYKDIYQNDFFEMVAAEAALSFIRNIKKINLENYKAVINIQNFTLPILVTLSTLIKRIIYNICKRNNKDENNFRGTLSIDEAAIEEISKIFLEQNFENEFKN